MNDGETASIRGSAPRRVRRRQIAGATVILLALAGAGAWLARKPIAEHFIDDALRAREIPAHYRIARIGLRTQRLTNVRIGDATHPDLLADWIEVDTGVWTSGLSVAAIRAGHVRIRARLANGHVSFGAIDRLLPAPTGKPFALPAIHATITDARIALATPQGDVALAVSGAGRLDDGFAGMLGVTAPRLDVGWCRIERAAAALRVRIVQARPGLVGPVSAGSLTCGSTRLIRTRADLSVALGTGLDHWKGSAKLSIAALATADLRLGAVAGPVAFTGAAADVSGSADLLAESVSAIGIGAARGAVRGRYRYAAGGFAFAGNVGATHARLAPALSTRLLQWRGVGAGTPIGPLAAQALAGLAAAGRSADVTAALSAVVDGGRGKVAVSRIAVASASGLRGAMDGDVTYRWPGDGWRVDAGAALSGGGLPGLRARLRQAAAGAPLVGRVAMAPYAAGDARMTLAPIDFTAGSDGALRLATRATVSGPLAGGRIDAMRLPLTATWDGRSRLAVNTACAPVAFERLRVAGVDLRRSAVTLCPLDGALLRVESGAVRGGGRTGPVRLGGTLGAAPLELTVQNARWRLKDADFGASGLAVRLGPADRITRLDVAALAGNFGDRGVRGTFAGAGGQIGAVPLLLSRADGHWRADGGRFALDGTLTVADTAQAPRFAALAARGVVLTLAHDRIVATGTLFEPSRNVKVADVAIAHDLGTGAGQADLGVPGIVFDEHFQPELLTPVTLGLVANVAGAVSGAGHIRWDAHGVTSDGVFRTAGIDLAAAFGPATGIAGEVHFTDLLALETAPGQVATVGTVNPGVPVRDGTIRYRLLSGARVAVEQGRWPFAGGTLTLEPTLLDFGAAQERRMTFRVAGMQAGQFLQQFDFKNLDATGVFDGTLPMIFDARGGRIEDGHLVVRANGEGGGGTIAYVGEISQKDVGLWGNFAFQALKSLRYRNLDIVMNGPLAGEMVTEVRFAGVGQGTGAKRNFIIDRLQKLPLVFNVRIKAPFRQLIDTALSFYDPKRLVERNLPALLDEQNKRAAPPPIPVQPPDSRIVP